MSLFHSLGQLRSRKSQSKKVAERRHSRKANGKRGLLFELFEDRSMMAITQIPLSNFAAPRVLDFQSVPTGPIPSNAAAFQAIGISSVVGTSDADVDTYSTGSPTASRALAATSTGLKVIDPNTGNASDTFGNNNTYTINFAQPQTRFGFTNDDSGGSNPTPFTFNIVLFSGATQVDSGSLLAPVFGQNPLYFSSTVAFDRVVISNGLGDGFVIDNLTTETPGPTITISPGLATINENDVASATITITNPDPTDTHSANINWGEGTPDTITGLGLSNTSGTVGATGYTWTAATRTLVVTHRYLDDNPTGTTSDIYTVTAKVADDDMSGNFNGTVGVDYVQATTTISVRNVVANYASLPGVSNPVFENGLCFINGTLSDPGTQDTFRFQVSWGDGTVDVIPVGAVSISGTIGGTNFGWNASLKAYSFSHRYLDDTPTDTVDIAVRVADDDMTGNFAGTNGVDFTLVGGTISLLNSPPSLGTISLTNATITEGGTANATLTITDQGTLDVFAANVNWGQGTPDTITGLGLTNTSGTVGTTSYSWTAATRVLNLTHPYPNDTLFTGNTNYTLTVKVADDDMTGNFAGGAGNTNYVQSTASITVIDDEGLPPQIIAPSFIGVNEDQVSSLPGISFTAAGTGSVAVTATFSVPSGTLTATSSGNVTVNGSGTGSLTLDGTPAAINTFIAGSNLKFQSALNQVSTVTLTIGINDNGSGGAPAQTASTTAGIIVNPVNDNPINTLPTIGVVEDTPIAVTGFTIADVDSTGPFSVNIRFNNAQAGILTLRTDVPGGLTGTMLNNNVLNNGTSNLLIIGASLGAINTTLSATNGLVYTPANNFNGLALFAVDTNSDGNGGSDVGDTAIWTVSAVNDAPTITAPATFSAQQGIATSLTGISFADVDAGAGSVSVEFGVASGTLTAAASGSVTIGGSGTGLVTLSGTIANINTYLSGSNLSHSNTSFGAVALTISIEDNGNTGSGGFQTATTTSTINVPEMPSLIVTTASDIVDALDGLASLREALAFANSDPGADTITFGDGSAIMGGTNFTDSTPDTILLTQGELAITTSLTITGNGATNTIIDGNNASRIFKINDGTSAQQVVTITGVTLQRGSSGPGGGAIDNRENLSLSSSTIAHNSSRTENGGGGGVYNNGTFMSTNVTFAHNSGAVGGGVYNLATFTSTNDTIAYNSASLAGGVYNSTLATFTSSNSTIANNTSKDSGGVLNEGTFTSTNNTIASNSATSDFEFGSGGVVNYGTFTSTNDTIANNSVNFGIGGVLNFSIWNARNTIVAGSAGGVDVQNNGFATINASNMLIGDTSISGTGITNGVTYAAIFGANVLADNGGPTQTIALTVNSPAIDAGSNALAVDANNQPLTTDQRGLSRIVGGTVDIGAFEADEARSFIVTTNSDVVDARDDLTSLREAINYANSDPDANTITFGDGTSIGGTNFTDGTPETIVVDSTLLVSSEMTIQGSGAKLLTLSGNDQVRIFVTDDDSADTQVNISLLSLTISHGFVSLDSENGGGIYNRENLTLNEVILSNCQAANGSALFSESGNVVILNSSFFENSARSGVIHQTGGSISVFSSTIANNGDSDGIASEAGDLTTIQSTIFTLAFISATPRTWTSRNSIFSNVVNNASTEIVSNSLFFMTPNNIVGGVNGNITDAVPTDVLATDSQGIPLLADNGGPTPTIALAANSPAINAGSATLLPADVDDLDGDGNVTEPIPFDQRGAGFVRIAGADVDIGAFEVQPVGPSQFLIAFDPATGNWFGSSLAIGQSQVLATWDSAAGFHDGLVADFNGDGNSDIAARDALGRWFVGIAQPGKPELFQQTFWGLSGRRDFKSVQTADVNGDGKADIVAFESGAGTRWRVFVSTGSAFTSQVVRLNSQVKWADPVVGDFNGDGRADVAARFRRNQAGFSPWWVVQSQASGLMSPGSRWGNWKSTPWKDVKVADYNGDGKDDIVGRDPATGTWRIAQSNGTRFVSRDLGKWKPDAAAGWHNVLIADLDGDGKDDIAGQDSTGKWSWIYQVGRQDVFIDSIGTWSPADNYKSVFAADLDHDGTTEIFGRRGTNGVWRIDQLDAFDQLQTLKGYTLEPDWDEAVDWMFASLGDSDEVTQT